MNFAKLTPPPQGSPPRASSSSRRVPHPAAALRAQSPLPSRNHHVFHRQPPRFHPNAEQTSGTLPATAGYGTAPALPSAPPPYCQSSPGGSLRTLTSRVGHPSQRCFRIPEYSDTPALRTHDCSAPPQPAHAHISDPTLQRASPDRTAESVHAIPHTAFPFLVRLPARTHNHRPIRLLPCPLQ